MYEFTTWLRHQRYSDQTIRQYVNYTRRALGALGTLTNADTETLARWVGTLSDSCGIGARKALIAWFEFRRARHNPALGIQVRRASGGSPSPLTPEQRARFLTAADALGGIHRAVGYLFEFTGARISSVRFAHWRGVDFNAGTWTFHAKGANRSGPKTLTVPLHPDLIDVLRVWRTESRSSAAVFPGPTRGGVISEARLRAVHDDIVTHARLGHVVPHQHRATVATITYDATGDIYAVSELLGHANLDTTRRHYARASARRVRAAVLALPGASEASEAATA